MDPTDEFGWIEHIRARFGGDDPRVEIGIGDDAAVLSLGTEGRVLSVDTAVEGVHFDRAWLSPEDVGWRAYVAALSDLAAMGAEPVAGLLSLVVPDDENPAWMRRMLDGIAEAAAHYGAPVVGGNLATGRMLTLSTTVVGRLLGAPLRRGGARPGDGVYLSGPVGEAGLGWRVLSAGGVHNDAERRAVQRWRRPAARFDVARTIHDRASAAIDISDGVAQDLGHIAAESGVRIRIELGKLPLSDGFAAAAAARGEDPIGLALSGGEDYELAFTSAKGDGLLVGEVIEGAGVVLVDASGDEHHAPDGHRHLQSR